MVNTDFEKILRSRGIPAASGNMAKMVSPYRRERLEEEVARGDFRERGNTGYSSPYGFAESTPAGFAVSSASGLKKYGQAASGAGGFRGSGGSVRQIPEIYSPLWLNSNLNLPRDRATINAWSRAFFALNPIIQNAISLHSTYPISKLTIKCKDEGVQQFFEDMIEEIDLMNICVQIAQEYWVMGEAFVYAELDERSAKWSRILLQNPDYVNVKHSVVAGEPILSLRPDENLKRIVNSNRPSDMQQRQRLDKSIIEHVRRGENIPLSNFYASHIARKLNPYETRGTGLIVSCFRNLMLYDKLRECHDEETEVLTKDGFKKISELLELTSESDVNSNYIAGVSMQEELSILALKNNVEIACFNRDTEEIEYHKPNEIHVSHYEGEMLHFTGKKVDVCVTPNHKMWVKEKFNDGWGQFELRPAKSLLNKKTWYKFKSNIKWNGKTIESVAVGNKSIPIKLYLKILGYLASEGCLYKNFDNNRYDALLSVSQLTNSSCYQDMYESFNAFSDFIGKRCNNKIATIGAGFSKATPKEKWECRIHGKDIVNHFIDELGVNGKADSYNKTLPRWVFELDTDLLNILLQSLVEGDGSCIDSKYNSETKGYRYSTVSKRLADDVYELAFKCGFAPNINLTKRKNRDFIEYTVLWSTTNYGNEPNICTAKSKYGAKIKSTQYKGVVWCFDVPTGLFITRRNNRISINGNSKFAQADGMINPLTLIKIGSETYKPSPTDLEQWRQVFEEAQYDKDFKIFTHEAVTVERVGYNAAIVDISPDIEKLTKEIYIGLYVPQVLMDGGGDVTYANGGITLDVLKQRYLQFRNMLSSWLRRKIFAPISKINDFYEKKDGKKILIVPEVEWNHMSLFDAGDYIQTLVNLLQAGGTEGATPKVSLQTVYRSLGLDYDDENRKMKTEAIQDAIYNLEASSLGAMDLNELRTIGPDDIIEQKDEKPVPGEAIPGQEGGEGGMDLGMPGLSGPPPGGGGDLGAVPEAPPPEAAPAPGGEGGGAPPAP